VESKKFNIRGSSQFSATFDNFQIYRFTHRWYNFRLTYKEGESRFYVRSDLTLWTCDKGELKSRAFDIAVSVGEDGTAVISGGVSVKMPLLHDGTWDLETFCKIPQFTRVLDKELGASLRAAEDYIPVMESNLLHLKHYVYEMKDNLGERE